DIVSAFGRAGATTIAIDVNPLAPALYHASHYHLVQRVDHPEYVQQLRRIIGEHDARLVVPLTDLDQELLARRRGELAPALVLLPDAEIVAAMADKYRAHELFIDRGIGSPDSWLPPDVPH